jgi:hypothetical protein
VRVWDGETVEVDGWAERRWSYSGTVSRSLCVVEKNGMYKSE